AVVPPAPAAKLGAAPINHCSFALAEVTQEIGSKTPGITDPGENSRAGRGIADGSASVFVHSYARHPTPQTIVAVGPILLLNRRSREGAAGNIELIPTDSSRPIRVIQKDGLISPQRFGAVAILVNNRRHDFVAQSIQLCRGA